MKKIKFKLEYECSPIWVYDSEGKMICNGLTDIMESKLDADMIKRLQFIKEKYESLFENSEVYFGYIGFSSEEDRLQFINEIRAIIQQLVQDLGAEYQIEAVPDLTIL